MPRYIFTAAGRTALDNQNIDALSDALGLDGGLDAAVTALAEDPASAFAVSQSSTFAVSATYREIVQLTQAQYDALGTPDASTLYVIVG